jgi:hypothetical protein
MPAVWKVEDQPQLQILPMRPEFGAFGWKPIFQKIQL